MRLGKTMLMAGTAYLALTAPGFAQGSTDQQRGSAASTTWATCMDVRDELRRKVQAIDEQGNWMNQVDNLIAQARDSRTPAACLRTLQQANQIVARETGNSPISQSRFQMVQRGDASRSAWDRSGTDRMRSATAQDRNAADDALADSDARRVPVAFAHSIVGVSVTDSNGDPAGEIEYLVIDTDTSEIKFAVLGSGGFLELGEEYTAVPWEQLNVGLDAGRPYVDISATVDKLKEGTRLRYDTLNQLTNMEYQTRIIDYWVPTGDDQSDTSSRSQRDRMASGGSSSSDMDRNQRQYSGSGDRDASRQRQGYTDFRERAGLSDDSGQYGSRTGQQRQARSELTNPSGTSGDRRSDDRGSSSSFESRQDRAQQDRQRETRQSGSGDDSSLMLAGRQFITVLAPSSLKTGRQLRGAEVISRDGEELGEIDRLVVDLDRGYVAYALVSQGGFLGIGEEWRPVPLSALNWRRNETYALSQSSDQLKSSPRLARAELPDRVRTADLRKLYQSYQVTPYWQQTQQQDGAMRSGEGSGSRDMQSSGQGSGSRDRMQSDQQR